MGMVFIDLTHQSLHRSLTLLSVPSLRTLQCLLSVPETSEICLQDWAAFYLTLTTPDAGSSIWNQGLMQVETFIASIIYAPDLLFDQPLIPIFQILINI